MFLISLTWGKKCCWHVAICWLFSATDRNYNKSEKCHYPLFIIVFFFPLGVSSISGLSNAPWHTTADRKWSIWMQ